MAKALQMRDQAKISALVEKKFHRLVL
jgi:hypothetical protein